MLQKNKDIAKTDSAKPADQGTGAASHDAQLPDLRDRVVNSSFSDVSPDIGEKLDERLKAIELPTGRVIREGDYPPMQAVQTEDGTWVLIEREKPNTLWGRVKALLF